MILSSHHYFDSNSDDDKVAQLKRLEVVYTLVAKFSVPGAKQDELD
jgi:hypothetical protein